MSSVATNSMNGAAARPPSGAPVHAGWVRATHWVNALSVAVMAASGWKIYNASPLFGFRFPGEVTLGGWLAGAIQWHFAAMWLLAANGLLYLALNLASGRFVHRFLPVGPREAWRDLRAALAGRLAHDDLHRYNALQKCAYLAAIAGLTLLVLSGLVLWKSVQFPLLRESIGGYEGARVVHFAAMAAVVAFGLGHAAIAVAVPRSLLAMIRGR